MKVFLHHIYEYQKGLRNLVLFTGHADCRELIECKLKKSCIDYAIYPLGKTRINVFFGESVCVATVQKIGCEHLSGMSLEHDYMLGIMLGYDRIKQSVRYLKRSALRADKSEALRDENERERLVA